MKWLTRHRRTFIVIALVTTPLCTVGYSGANFTASSVNPNNAIQAAADFVAPVVTLTAPTGRIANHFPTFTGAAGVTTGDLPTVTLRIWSGSTTTGPPAFTYTGSGASGSYSIPRRRASPMAPGPPRPASPTPAPTPGRAPRSRSSSTPSRRPSRSSIRSTTR